MCKVCRGYGYVTAYKAPIVVREYCKCELGQRNKEFIERSIKKDTTPVWELFSL